MPDSPWICWNMPDFIRKSLNMPKSAWMAFVSIVIPWLLECVVDFFNKVYSLNEHEIWIRQNLIFSVVAGSIWFGFCFKLNIKVFVIFGVQRDQGSWILIYQMSIFNRCLITLHWQIDINHTHCVFQNFGGTKFFLTFVGG